MSRITLALMWLVHWLPLPLLAGCGRLFGLALYTFGRERRHIALTNLGLCFPELGDAEKSALARRHFEAFGRSFLERGLLWWAAPARIKRLVRIEGLDRLEALRDRPVILLAPHFVGLDMGWTRLTLERDLVSMYSRQKNPVFNAALYRGRLRFGEQALASRQDGIRPVVRALKRGRPFYYLPDLDYGRHDAIFVPFFGVPAATITGLSRLARLSSAVVVPVVTEMMGNNGGYVVRIGDAWTDFPGESIATDTRRMNAFIEGEVLKLPAQYFWLHKRFKTRPRGENKIY